MTTLKTAARETIIVQKMAQEVWVYVPPKYSLTN